MRAIWMREFGGPEVLVAGEAPDPEPGPGQARIDVAFANITFVETQFRATGFGPYRAELPMIPGNGVGGFVHSVGTGVDASLVGARVISSTGGSGGYAERVAVDASGVIVVPDEVALDDATALLADGRTAIWLMTGADVQPGERVLVEAAAGGVGSLLVQLASAAGATVVGAARGERKLTLVEDLGASFVVDYGVADWTAQVLDATGGIDVVFDGVGGEIASAAFELIVPGGRMRTYGAASGEWTAIAPEDAERRDVTLLASPPLSPRELQAYSRRALEESAAGRLHPVIGQRFALEDASAAHAAMQARTTLGKTLLVVRP